MPKLVNLGSLCIDNVYSVPNITASGETVASLEYAVYAGGKGLNQSLAAARAGARVVHVGCVGSDGRWLKAELSKSGVDVAAVREADSPSGHAVIQVNPSGENAIVISGGANRTLDDADIETAFSSCEEDDWLLLQNEINKMEDIFKISSNKRLKLALNLAPVDERIGNYDLGSVDLLIVNEVEAQALSGRSAVDDAFEALCARYPSCDVVVTLGRDGLRYGRGPERIALGAFEVEAVDETGAGDAFVGYLMAALLEGQRMQDALIAGSAAGALATTRAGAASSIPDREAVSAVTAVAAMQRRAKETDADQFTLEDINAEVEAARRQRKG